jgi:hypothetical protein
MRGQTGPAHIAILRGAAARTYRVRSRGLSRFSGDRREGNGAQQRPRSLHHDTVSNLRTAAAAAEPASPVHDQNRTGDSLLSRRVDRGAKLFRLPLHPRDFCRDAGRPKTAPFHCSKSNAARQARVPRPSRYRTMARASTYPPRLSAPLTKRARFRFWISCRKSSRRPHPKMPCRNPRRSRWFRRGDWPGLRGASCNEAGARPGATRRGSRMATYGTLEPVAGPARLTVS